MKIGKSASMFKAAFGMVGAIAMSLLAHSAATEYYPPLDTDLNNFDPEVAVGRYIQSISSNTVKEVVSLTNGVLTVGGETINVASPTHMVVTTNAVDGTVTTNYYDAVYEDGLESALMEYAKIRKAIIIDNGDGTLTTNWTEVAYLDDIPADSKKADKVIRLWDYYCPQARVLLGRSLDKDAPFSSWEWMGDTNGFTRIALSYTNGVWNCQTNNMETYFSVTGAAEAASIDIGGLSFVSTNNTGYAFVVYTDQMEKVLKEELYGYVSKTNLYSLSGRITEDKLTTIGGIVEILRGIRNELNSIAGGMGIRMRFAGVTGATLVLQPARMLAPGDSVEIDWGDGSEKETTVLPARHAYGSSVTNVDVIVNGFIKGISGTNGVPFASLSFPNDSTLVTSALVGFRADATVGLEEIGDYAFYGCTGLAGDLTILPYTIKSFGAHAFEGSGLTSLAGFPSAITEVSPYCFAKTAIPNLAGLSPGVDEIGDYAFSECMSFTSISGISAGLVKLGRFSFSGCTYLSSLDGLSATAVKDIPEGCFRGTYLTSISGLPVAVTNIGVAAFADAPRMSVADGSQISLVTISSNAFARAPALSELVVPDSVVAIGELAFADVAANTSSLEVYFQNRMYSDVTDIPIPGSSAKAFPWGLPTTPQKTRIVCADGELVSNGTGWTTNSLAMSFALSGVRGGAHDVTVSIGEVGTAPTARSAKRGTATSGIKVDWGDGTIMPIETGATHTYASTAGTVTDINVRLIGNVYSIGGQGEGAPFITADGTATNLTQIEIGNAVNLASLGQDSFRGCTGLNSIKGLPATLVSIGSECFAGCSSISNLDFLAEAGVTALPSGCFRDCSGLLQLSGIQSSGITYIGDGCFSNCTGLAAIQGLPSALEALGVNAFRDCTGIRGIELPSKVTTVSTGCFSRCTNIVELTTALNGVSIISQNAFADCISLTNIVLREAVSIGRNAFYNVGNSSDNRQYTDEDGFTYKVVVSFPNSSYTDAEEVLGLRDGATANVSGLEKEITKIDCDNGYLLYNDAGGAEGYARWEVVVPAIEFELKGVTNGTTLAVQTGGTHTYDAASLVWNWGDGNCERWITSSPKSHTFTNAVPSDYIVKVKGMLHSINSGSRNSGAYIRPANATTVDNPFIVGFSLPTDSPVRAIGRYSFSKCPNLKNINTQNLPRTRGTKKGLRRDTGKETRLQKLSAVMTEHEVEYGEYCFADSGIESMAGLPRGMTSITNGLFADDVGLASLVDIPPMIVDIYDSAFENTGIMNLYGYPLGVRYISNYCFAGCYWLNDISDLGDSYVTDIGDYSFSSCTNLGSLYRLPPTLTSIGNGAFMNSGLQSLDYMPLSVRNIGLASFAYCPNLTNIDGLGSGVSNIPQQAFMACTSMVHVTIPLSVTNIGDYAFSYCSALTNIVIGERVQSMGDSPLQGCSTTATSAYDVESNRVVLTVTCLGRKCAEIRDLIGNENLDSFGPLTKFVGKNGYIINDGSRWVDRIDTTEFRVAVLSNNTSIELGDIIPKEGFSFHVDWGDGFVEEGIAGHQYQHTYNKGVHVITIKGKLQYLGSSSPPLAFLHSTNHPIEVQQVVFGNNVGLDAIGDSAFRGYSSLIDFSSFSNLMTRVIGAHSFDGCSQMEDLSWMPQTVEEISTNAFANCSKVKSIAPIGQSNLISIHEGAFENCTSLTNLVGLGEMITNVPPRCFAGCISLKNLEGVSSRLVSIEQEAFSNCTSLSSVANLSNILVRAIGAGAFFNCSSLESISMSPHSLVSLGARCFEGCTGLQSLDNETLVGVESVGDGCFALCTGLHSVTGFPSTVGMIGPEMFYGCSSLEDMDGIKGFATNLAESAFQFCGFRKLKVPDSVVAMQNLAMADCYNATNVLFLHAEVPSMAADAMRDIGRDAAIWFDGGEAVKTTLSFPSIMCDTVLQADGFPWGVPNETTKFGCADGYLVYRNGNWIACRSSLDIELSIVAGQTFEIGQMILAGDSSVTINWGDGQFTTNVLATGNVRHTYPRNGRFTISLVGDILSIYSAVPDQPFLRHIVGGKIQKANPYIESVVVPKMSRISSIGPYAFYRCGLWKFANYGAFLTDIAERAFSFSSLRSISNFGSITNYGAYAFEKCHALYYSTISKAAVEGIGIGCFGDCQRFGDSEADKTIVWPSAVAVLPMGVFSNCTMISQLRVENTCEGISSNSLYNIGASLDGYTDGFGNTYKTSVYILHKTGEEVMYGLFSKGGDAAAPYSYFPFGAPHTTKFECQDGYISFSVSRGQWEFRQFGLLFHIEAVKAGDVVNLAPIDILGETAAWFWGDDTASSITSGQTASHTYLSDYPSIDIVLSGKTRAIKGFIHEGSTTNSMVGIVRTQNSQAQLTGVRINADCGVEEIGDFSFYNNVFIKEILMQGGKISSLGESAFEGCESLRELDFSAESITEIGAAALRRCINIEDVYLGKALNIADIGNGAFDGMGSAVALDRTNEYGRVYRTGVHADELLSEQVVAGGVARMSPSTNTIFTTFDGYVGWDDAQSAWMPYEHAIVLSFNPSLASHDYVAAYLTIGDIELAAGDSFKVNWGRGAGWEQVSTNELGQYNSPTYELQKYVGTVRIGIKGDVAKISGREAHSETLYNNSTTYTGGLISFQETMPQLGRKYSLPQYMYNVPAAHVTDNHIGQTIMFYNEGQEVTALGTTLEGIDNLYLAWEGPQSPYSNLLTNNESSPRDFQSQRRESRAYNYEYPELPWITSRWSNDGERSPTNGITSIRIGNQVPLNAIGKYTFLMNESLTNLYGAGFAVTNIPEKAFLGCRGLARCPNSSRLIESVDDYAFAGCTSITNIAELPGCKRFGIGAFAGCTGLKSIEGMNAGASVDGGCFMGCSSLESVNGFCANGSNGVPSQCFMGCKNLKDIDALPLAIEGIGFRAFYESGITNVSRLSSLTNLQFIEDEAFMVASNLNHSIVLPQSLYFVGNDIFRRVDDHYGYTSEGDVYFHATNLVYWTPQTFTGRTAYIPMTMEDLLRGWQGDIMDNQDRGLYGWGRSVVGLDVVFNFGTAKVPAGIRIRLCDVQPNETITIKHIKSDDYRIMVDWGDGQVSYYDAGVMQELSHQYDSNNLDYTVYIGGHIVSISNSTASFIQSSAFSDGTNPRVTSICFNNISHVNHAQGLIGPVFKGLTRCSEIQFGKADNTVVQSEMNLASGIFYRLGESLPATNRLEGHLYSNTALNLRFKTKVVMDSVLMESLAQQAHEFDINHDESILVECFDGCRLVTVGKNQEVDFYGFSATVESEPFTKQPPQSVYMGPFSCYSSAVVDSRVNMKVPLVLSILTPQQVGNAKIITRGSSSSSGEYMIESVPVLHSNIYKHTTYTNIAGNATDMEINVGGSRITYRSGERILLDPRKGTLVKLDANTYKYIWEVNLRGNIQAIDEMVEGGVITRLYFMGGLPALKELPSWKNIKVPPEEVFIPNSITTLRDGCFKGCDRLKTLDWLPSSITTIGAECFAGSSLGDGGGISNLTYLTRIGKRAFANCGSLSGVLRFPLSLLTIGEDAFLNDTQRSQLRKVRIPYQKLKDGNGRTYYTYTYLDNYYPRFELVFPKTRAQIQAMAGFPWDSCFEIHTSPVDTSGFANDFRTNGRITYMGTDKGMYSSGFSRAPEDGKGRVGARWIDASVSPDEAFWPFSNGVPIWDRPDNWEDLFW